MEVYLAAKSEIRAQTLLLRPEHIALDLGPTCGDFLLVTGPEQAAVLLPLPLTRPPALLIGRVGRVARVTTPDGVHSADHLRTPAKARSKQTLFLT